MKLNHSLLLSIFTLISFSSLAQVYGNLAGAATGNVNSLGVGVNSPLAKLDVLTGNSLGGLLIRTETSNGMGGAATTPYAFRIQYTNYLTVGSPTTVLESGVNGSLTLGPGSSNHTLIDMDYLSLDNSMALYQSGALSNSIRIGYDLFSFGSGQHDDYTGIIWDNSAGTADFFQISSTENVPVLTLAQDGRVGINTTDMNGSHKLYVDGSILATELELKLKVDWPDFVFEKDYELQSLSEVETFISENGHLPSIPSAEEVNLEGIGVGEMEALLLQKVEELTLYLIEQEKQINALKAEVERLQQ